MDFLANALLLIARQTATTVSDITPIADAFAAYHQRAAAACAAAMLTQLAMDAAACVLKPSVVVNFTPPHAGLAETLLRLRKPPGHLRRAIVPSPV
jgi:hypothetical protein